MQTGIQQIWFFKRLGPVMGADASIFRCWPEDLRISSNCRRFLAWARGIFDRTNCLCLCMCVLVCVCVFVCEIS